MRQISDKQAKYERALAIVMRIHHMMGLQNVPLPLVSRGTTPKPAPDSSMDLSTTGNNASSSISIGQVFDKIVAPSKLVNLSTPSSLPTAGRIAGIPTPIYSTAISQAIDLHTLQGRSSPLTYLPPHNMKNVITLSPSLDYINTLEHKDPTTKRSSMLNQMMVSQDVSSSRLSQDDNRRTSGIASTGGFLDLVSLSASARVAGHPLNAITVPLRSGALAFAKPGSIRSTPLPVTPMTGFVRDDVPDVFESHLSTNNGMSAVLPLPFRRSSLMTSDYPGVKSGSARLHQTVALESRGEQVVPNHPTALSSVSAMSSPDVYAGTRGAVTNSQVINLTGSIIVDGRRLGQVTASTQAREISLPPRGPSRVNLRAVPIYSGIQIPS